MSAVPSMAELAERIGAEWGGDGTASVRRVVEPGPASLPGDLVLAMQAKHFARLEQSGAELAVISAGAVPPAQLRGWIVVEQPRYALARLLQLFEKPPRLASGIHPSAVIEPSAQLHPTVRVGALCYVGEGVVIEKDVSIMSQVTISAMSRIGAGSLLYPGVRIGEDTWIGERAIIQANVCIGGAGFSFATPEPGSVDSAKAGKKVTASNRGITRIPSLGRVVIEDEVEIGAGATIDRATLGETRIRRGSKIDNQVMIAHNCVVGEDCLIAGQAGIAGSCRIGNRVVMGGQVGVADHVEIGDDAVLAAGAGVAYDVPQKAFMILSPAIPYRDFTVRYRALARVQRLLRDVQELTQRVLRLERER